VACIAAALLCWRWGSWALGSRLYQPRVRGWLNGDGSFATYAVEVAHPVEVGAEDEAHLVKWLSKRPARRSVPTCHRTGSG
jgi:anti-sigma factor RsiW